MRANTPHHADLFPYSPGSRTPCTAAQGPTKIAHMNFTPDLILHTCYLSPLPARHSFVPNRRPGLPLPPHPHLPVCFGRPRGACPPPCGRPNEHTTPKIWSKAEEGDGSSLQVASGGRGETANTSLLSEQALLLHSLSTPNMSGVGAAGLFGGGGGAGAFDGSGGEHGGGVEESSTGPPSLLSKAGGREAEGQNGGTTGVRGSGDTLLPPLLLSA